ncbi:N-formylglutamate amidohydrolase [Candidatus Poseidoniales archaeon]|jgi:hypothetical protein|nr:N-formylglutamate amidohydrolase [Candidatus Poseidoniales archaeon]
MLIVTVPHAKSNQTEGTGFDAGAIEFIGHLETALDDKNVKYIIHVGESHRELVDLNRKESYSTDYHQELRTLLKHATLHIDLHSFPFVAEDAEDEESITSLGDDLRSWSVHDLVILETDGVSNREFINTVLDEMETEFDMSVVDSTVDNYITVVASILFKVPSVLIEVNDQSVEAFPLMASALARAVADFA